MTDRPRCYDCLTGDVAVKVTDLSGSEHWFCAADWAAEQEFHDKITELLEKAAQALDGPPGLIPPAPPVP